VVRNHRRFAAVQEACAILSACVRRKIVISRDAPILGIDVGEDFLDLAILTPDRARFSYHRVPLDGIAKPVAAAICDRIVAASPIDLRGAVALIDSPRAPRDVDCSGPVMVARLNAPSGRLIDSALRDLLRRESKGTISMFPTPRAEYFAGCIASATCKPHLRAIGEELLASVGEIREQKIDGPIAGGTFTRFMLAGFGVFRALEELGIRVFEAYPDLVMRLWSEGESLPPKKSRGEALRVRASVCARLARVVGIRKYRIPTTLDEADAAVLALSAAASSDAGALDELHCPAEGRFAVAFASLDKARMRGLQR
jgi:predicted nuclease with RNAse H fold